MSKKFNLNLSKINSKKVPAVTKIESLYNINYEELDISGTEKEKLIKYENDITFHKEKSIEHIFKYSKAIFEANQIFSNRGNGLFGKWIEKLGIDRDSANVAIRKYSLFLEYQTKGLKKPEKVLELPNRTVKTLTGQKKDNFKETEIIEVITSDNPSSKLKEIEEQKEAIKLSDIEEKRIFLTREKVKRHHLIKKIREEIRDIEEKIKSLN